MRAQKAGVEVDDNGAHPHDEKNRSNDGGGRFSRSHGQSGRQEQGKDERTPEIPYNYVFLYSALTISWLSSFPEEMESSNT